MTDIPSISITQDISDNEDGNTESLLDNTVATDCENLNSDSDSDRVTTGTNLVAFTKKNRKPRQEIILTDCEMMNDSDDDDDVQTPTHNCVPITLEEFLDQGFTDETTKYNGRHETSHDGPRKPIRNYSPLSSNHLKIASETGGITDCEDMDGFDSNESEEASDIELPIYLDENNTMESHDSIRPIDQHHITTTDSSSSSASSGDEHTPFKAKRKQTFLTLSDTENVVLSDYESYLKTCPKKKVLTDLAEDEIITVELSDAEDIDPVDTDPSIGIQFTNTFKQMHKPGTPQFSKFLAVLQDPNEGLTDVENLNSDDDDDDDDENVGRLKIPSAVARTENAYLTDTEDLDNMESDIDEGDDVASNITLPKPVRQLIMVQETNTGAPISKVLPLADNLSLAADVGYQDKGLTDTEDLSGNEEMYDISKYLIESVPDMEAGQITSSDKMAPSTSSTLGIMKEYNDPITDTEDMGEIKEPRKKRHRHRHSNRNKNRLAIANDDDGHTDVEELLLNDQGTRRYSSVNEQQSTPLLTINNVDDGGHTDVEILSGDEEGFAPRGRRMQRNSSPNILNKSDWNSAVASKECVQERGKANCNHHSLNMNLPRIRKLSPTPDAGHTDIEEMDKSDDDEDDDVNRETPIGVHRQLDENNSTVHDRNTSVFNERMERMNIKGHRDIQESLTDVEYVEDDLKQ